MELLEEHKVAGGRQQVWRHTSRATGGSMDFSLFLPPAADHGAVPLLTYLSGLTCTWQNVTEKGGFQRAAAEAGVAILCPDTSPRGDDVANDDAYDLGQGAGFYVNATQAPWAPHFQMEDYIASELYGLVLESFPIAQGPQGIFGHSMGGHGALTLGLRYPEQYKSVSAFAPIVSPSTCPWGEKALSAYLGEDRAGWEAHDACALIKAGRRTMDLLVDQGGGDPFLEEQLQPQKLVSACKEMDLPLTYREHAGYDHSYYFISTFMNDHIDWHAKRLLS